jgi:EAL domain-containing protein (putative c-di-GMP-specific phosphodiesterase class I)
MKLDHAMRQALANNEFRLHYQPQIEMATGAIIGAEALLRWRHAEMGQVAPDRFIPLAEESGFIIPLGDWVLKEAVRQAAQWRAQGMELVVAVNVSALQFQKTDFVTSVSQALEASGLPPAALELELTESILVQGVDEAIPRLRALADLGVQLSIDDFGSGYSSLTYLKRFPIHKLKIDRSFIHGLPADDSDCAISTAIVKLGQALKLKIVAEGVETESQRDFLQAADCDQFQGWLVSAALPPEQFEAFLAQHGKPV